MNMCIAALYICDAIIVCYIWQGVRPVCLLLAWSNLHATHFLRGYSCDPTYYTTHFRYGLQAAMNLRSLEMSFPCSRWSHMISLIRPIASVVFASSKNTTVSSLWRVFLIASFSAFSTNFVMSDSVIPPCTCTCVFVLAHKEITRLVQFQHNQTGMRRWPIFTFIISMLFLFVPWLARLHM